MATNNKDRDPQISFEVSEQLKSDFDSKLGTDRTTQKHLLTSFIEEYLGGQRKAPPKPPPQYPELHELLDEVLASGHKKAIAGVTASLQVSHELVKLANEARPRRKS